MHFHLLGNVVDVSLAYLHRCTSRRSWFAIMFHGVVSGLKAEGDADDPITSDNTVVRLVGSSLVHNVTSRSYPIVLHGLLFTRRYLPSPRTCPAVMKAGRESSPQRRLLCTSPLSFALDIGGRSALGFGHYVSRPLLCTYRSSALLACAIFLTALNTVLTEIPERFPAR